MGQIAKKGAPWSTPGSIPPFFDRFEGASFMAENHLTTLDFYTREQTIASIERNVSAILNTRATLTLKDYALLKPGTLTYGYPELFGLCDFSFFSPENSTSWAKSSVYMENALRLFEPRLRNAKAVIQAFHQETQSLSVSIMADAKINNIVERLIFPTAIYNIPYNKARGAS